MKQVDLNKVVTTGVLDRSKVRWSAGGPGFWACTTFPHRCAVRKYPYRNWGSVQWAKPE